jgi:hypothetical protein
MAEIDWLKTAFTFGYDSGEILDPVPSSTRLKQEILIGGSYRTAFFKAVFPFLRPDSNVLELGPGKGSWSRAILNFIPEGTLTTVDFVDVTSWLRPEDYAGRLICHQAADFSLSELPDDQFDFAWSFGVLCHHTIEQIEIVLTKLLRKTKIGGVSVHQYADWNKIYKSGRPLQVADLIQKSVTDLESWWPSNSKPAMAAAAERAGWRIVFDDLDLFERDGIIVLKRW